MLESFILKEEDAVRVRHEDLRATTSSIFEKMGVPSGDAAEVARLDGLHAQQFGLLKPSRRGKKHRRQSPDPRWG